MSGIDEMLEQAEAQQNADEWEILNKYRREVTYVDDDGYVNIVDRKIDPIKENISVQGEQYSQYIEFLMDRFYDGVDLAEQTIAIHYEVEDNGGEDTPVNVYKNSTQLKFGWVIGPNVAQYAQPVEFCIWVRGTLVNGNNYVLKTLPQTYTPKRGLMLGGGIPQPDNNWYLQFSLSMDDKVNQSALNASQAVSSANEAKTAEIVVLQAQQEVSQKSEVVDTQYKEIQIMHKEAEQYRDESLQFRNEAEQFLPDGYSALVEQVNKNTLKVDTIIEKADLGIKNTASGEEIYLFDSANGKPPEFSLLGKAKQETTSGKNLLQNTATTKTIKGVTFTVNDSGSVSVKGTNDGTGTSDFFLIGSWGIVGNIDVVPEEDLIISGIDAQVNTGSEKINIRAYTFDASGAKIGGALDKGEGATLSKDLITPASGVAVYIVVNSGATVDTVIYPMIRLASIEDDTYEPYTGGQPSPNPDYPQEIEVSGESYNLLKNTATSQIVYGVEFVVDEDNSVTVSGTNDGTALSQLILNHDLILPYGRYKRGPHSNNVKFLIQVRNRESGLFVKTLTTLEETFSNSDWDYELYKYTVILEIAKGVTVNGETLYPIIRKASVTNTRYMPYGKGSVEVKSVGKNKLKNMATSQTINNVELVVNKDGSVATNGTASDEITLILQNKISLENNQNYVLSGCPENGSDSTYRLQFWDGYISRNYAEYGNGIEFTYHEESVTNNNIALRIRKGVTVNNLTFKPMIRLASDTDDTYEPYKETIATIPTTDFAGIKVDSGGNYTDSNGQQWIANEIVKYADGSGEKIQRVEKKRLTSDLSMSKSSDTNVDRYLVTINSSPVTKKDSICTFATFTDNIQAFVIGEFTLDTNINTTRFSTNFAEYGTTTLDDFKAFLDGGEYYCLYVLPEPIHTPLTAEEIAEIENLSTFYPVTNITNDFDCGMEVTYLCDSKNYIDKKLAEMVAAMLNA